MCPVNVTFVFKVIVSGGSCSILTDVKEKEMVIN